MHRLSCHAWWSTICQNMSPEIKWSPRPNHSSNTASLHKLSRSRPGGPTFPKLNLSPMTIQVLICRTHGGPEIRFIHDLISQKVWLIKNLIYLKNDLIIFIHDLIWQKFDKLKKGGWPKSPFADNILKIW